MTIIIYGVGAIGGTIAARLALSGAPVTGIARGRQLEAIRENGLLLRTPSGDERVRFPCYADPAEMPIAPQDMIVLAMKGQDTGPALARLRDAGAGEQAIFCAQNGVANERAALRLFPNVYGVMVVMPSTYVTAGEVVAFGAPKAGIFDVGRFPSGLDEPAHRLVDALNQAGFAAFAKHEVMQSKYGKLLMNLGNVIDAAYGEAARQSPIAAAARREGAAVLKAAGIQFAQTEEDPRRQTLMTMQPIEGAARVGSSSAQSLARGAGSIETDWLNGEIVLLGRLNGVPVPINSWLMRLGNRLVTERRTAGSLPVSEALQALAPYLE